MKRKIGLAFAIMTGSIIGAFRGEIAKQKYVAKVKSRYEHHNRSNNNMTKSCLMNLSCQPFIQVKRRCLKVFQKTLLQTSVFFILFNRFIASYFVYQHFTFYIITQRQGADATTEIYLVAKHPGSL